MSNFSAVRRSPAGERIPDSSRGRGCCTGLGRISASGMVKKRPLNVTGSGPQQASSASTSSSQRAPRVRGSTSMTWCSSSDQPTLKPATSRPPDSRSMVDSCWASATGRCSPATRMLVPTTGRVVQAAAAVSVRNLQPGTGRVTRDGIQWIEDVLLNPEAAVAELLRLLAEGAQAIAVDVTAELGQAQADLHWGSRLLYELVM